MKTKNNLLYDYHSIILIIGILLSIYISWSTYQDLINHQKMRFNLETKEIQLLIKTRMDAYQQVLLGGAGLFASSDVVTRSMWKKYIDTQKIDKTFPGIQGIGYSEIILPNEMNTHIKKIRSEGFENYTVKPEGKRKIYSSIIYLEPFDERNKRAFGYDMYSEETRHKAMSLAIETGEPVMSGKVRLLQENNVDEQAGFLIYVPIYKKNHPLLTISDRYAAIKGFVYAPFRIKDLMQGVAGNQYKNIDFHIYDGHNISDDTLMYDSNVERKKSLPFLTSDKVIKIAGNDWTIHYSALSGYETEFSGNKHWYILIGGLSISFGLFGIIFMIRLDNKRKYISNKNLEALTLRMKLALQASGVGIWEWDFSTNQLTWDERMYDIYGMPQTSGTNPYDMWSNAVDENDRQSVEDNLNEAVKLHSEYNCKFWIHTPNGEKRYIHAIGVNEYDSNHKPIRMVGINLDVTEQKRYEDQLQELVQEETTKRIQQEKIVLQQSKMAAMGEMIGAIAHQWRQPLGVIGGILLNIEDQYNDKKLSTESLKNQIDTAEKNLLYMSKTIDDFRNFFSPSKSKGVFIADKNIIDSISIVDAQMKSHSISIEYHVYDFDLNEISNHTHQYDQMFSIFGYSNEFNQVLVNIFLNAKDAIEKNIKLGKIPKDSGRINIALYAKEKHVIITIEDNGGGISEEIIDRVFEPYFTTKEQGEGTGIGLYMSKMIIEESMNGKLEVSNHTEGAMFTITLATLMDNKDIAHEQ